MCRLWSCWARSSVAARGSESPDYQSGISALPITPMSGRCFCKARRCHCWKPTCWMLVSATPGEEACWATSTRGHVGTTTTQRGPCWKGTPRQRWKPAQLEVDLDGGGGERPRGDGPSSLSCPPLLYTLRLCVEQANAFGLFFCFVLADVGLGQWQANHRVPSSSKTTWRR